MQSFLAESAAGRLRFFGIAIALVASIATFALARPHHTHHHGHAYTHVGRCMDAPYLR
jgi:hypothetical protein